VRLEIFGHACLTVAMPLIWVATISLHILATVAWIGGMVFLSFVLAPLVRSRQATSEAVVLFRSSARRFRLVVWGAMTLLLITGPPLLAQRNIALMHPSTWPQIVVVKLGLVAVLFLFTFSHDLFLGQKFSRISAIPAYTRTAWERTVLASARWLPRLSLLIASAIVVAAAILARS
jgi:copper resistance protein D